MTCIKSDTGVEILKAPEDLVIYKPLPTCVILASVNVPPAIISVSIAPNILSAVIVVSLSNGVGEGLAAAKLAFTLAVLCSCTVILY